MRPEDRPAGRAARGARAAAVIAVVVLLAACGGAPAPAPLPPAPARAATTGPAGPAAPGPAPTAPAEACGVVRALRPACGACVKSQCCKPPVASSHELLQSLGCRLGCRRPAPQRDRLPPDRYIEILSRCLAGCDRLLPDPSGQAAPLDACITEFCLAECLKD
jgi:hypothetical protein